MHPRQYFPVVADSSDYGLLGEQSSPKWEMPMHHRAKFDATSIIFGGEICNHTNKQTNTHTYTKSVTDMSTPSLLVCVDNKATTSDSITG